MAHGNWGGRLPLANWLASRGFFAVVAARVRWQRLRNAWKRRWRATPLIEKNGPEAAAQLRHWLEQGYDRLNVGGGRKQLDGFVNVDFVATAPASRYIAANILDLSFIPTACLSQVHSNHVLEHLDETQIRDQLREYRRILKPGGLLTIRCPNALGAAFGFWFEPVVENDRSGFVALGFPADEDLSNPADVWGHRDLFGTMHWFYGDVGNPENQHLTVLTPSRLRRLVEEMDFEVLKMAEPEALNLVLVARAAPAPASAP